MWQLPTVARLRATDGSYDADSVTTSASRPATADRPPGEPAANGRFLYRFPSTFNSVPGSATPIAVETSNEGKIVIAGTCGNQRARALHHQTQPRWLF